MTISPSKLFLVLMLAANTAFADQVSLSMIDTKGPNKWIYVSQDLKIQYSHGEKQYAFLSYEQMHVCPDYCGLTFTIAGVGFGHRFNLGNDIQLFGQIGAYYVTNNVHYQVNNENIYYYMINRFNAGQAKSFTGYRVNNGNGIGAELGLDFPLTQHIRMQVYYRHLQFWTNYVAYLNNGYWHDPQIAKYQGYGVGIVIPF